MRLQSFLRFRRLSLWLATIVVVASCSDSPTEPIIDCSAVSLGTPLTHVVTNAASLRPALEDARDRILPALGVPPVMDSRVGELETAVAAADRVKACQAFNETIASFNTLVANSSAEQAPEIEVLRLTLQFARTWITSE